MDNYSNNSNSSFTERFSTALRDLPNALGQVFNFQRNVHELKTLKKSTKVMMTIMLLATWASFILGKDFGFSGWIGVITGTSVVLNLILVDQGRLTNYSWGVLGCVVWLIIAINNRLIGDIASQSFYLIMQFVGLSVWHREITQADQEEVASRKLTWREGIFWFLATFIIYFIVLFFSKHLNGVQVYLDATLLPLGIVGQVLMTYGYRSQWIAWITLDVINVVIWFNQLQVVSPASTSMFVLQIIMLANAIYGAYLWFKPSDQQ
ncbi:nicotinamide riboside transporter PnuC [Companilactobacillus futsaii]|uniref:Nicotinamide mononucleotide transporter n=2 Tax=Companilactobacillus futsaii TaxID=938155 RepID=A0A5B7T0E5_9LACO|nr:nicotinamide riboside transporter PnuC [Companilactobacillus futsaii]KRK96650.1 transport protein [Companilactobacillus futsaii JCM 17355]QCX24060.1 nicotinamide mononucleotide transporter [Companilactobacillus futsaii]